MYSKSPLEYRMIRCIVRAGHFWCYVRQVVDDWLMRWQPRARLFLPISSMTIIVHPPHHRLSLLTAQCSIFTSCGQAKNHNRLRPSHSSPIQCNRTAPAHYSLGLVKLDPIGHMVTNRSPRLSLAVPQRLHQPGYLVGYVYTAEARHETNGGRILSFDLASQVSTPAHDVLSRLLLKSYRVTV
ncbi:hypothetical protein K440DRAFT_24587 [Wilcoxina mikolae CBS 423.85]|nr:hypothetical protein K440DRAFT_24587 [Wilcoxina mikolae CBS 423.85]